MATNPSDGDMTDEHETTESTEASSEDNGSIQKNRKIDTDSVVLSEEEEEEEKKDEDEDRCESDQVWGFDSFDDTDFDTEQSDDDVEFEWNRYLYHVYKSRGFKVDSEIVPDRSFHGCRPFDFDKKFMHNISGREYMDNMAKLALSKYNQHNQTDVMFDHVVRAVVKMCSGIKSYVTFMAKESPQGDLIEYQAKTDWKVWQRNAHAILCRPALAMKPIPARYLPNPLPTEERCETIFKSSLV
ncbi:uncharacterized protein LOC9325534 isoform X5 [Arabidopsis lyrata subsp. lyrata]|uniref:uncharacterized protein LOC9325534 isoform X5 n=1 Tax=Arabidopsis lyrata subsp. lyrata TaxID=81972 RepID=UPI000A29E765|nr:uncharacterized protein LOC9325534 isoform X5 [Arabidopsis lyrata subsp. lyrata]|eukprot:XP_020869134.1 uncharacterized protein LOC9325534 isoform X5 [Arabidopsis lyrata subsp. lyrata]